LQSRAEHNVTNVVSFIDITAGGIQELFSFDEGWLVTLILFGAE
jgi:hypothetical protein